MEPVRGFEPLTCGLRNRCSATELHRLQLRIFSIFASVRPICKHYDFSFFSIIMPASTSEAGITWP